MRLKIPNGHTGAVASGGGVFYPDKNGVVDIPDDQVNSNLWGYGFTVLDETDTVEKSVKPAGKPALTLDKG